MKKKTRGTKDKPRARVVKSNKNIFISVINDTDNKTIFSVSSLSTELKKKSAKKKKTEVAVMVGELLAAKAKEKGINTAVFDRGSYRFHGRIKALVDSARKAGLKI